MKKGLGFSKTWSCFVFFSTWNFEASLILNVARWEGAIRCGSLTPGHEAAIGQDGDEPTKTHEGKDETHLDVDLWLVI